MDKITSFRFGTGGGNSLQRQTLGKKEAIAVKAAGRFGIAEQSLVKVTDNVFEGILNGKACMLKLMDGNKGMLEGFEGDADFLRHFRARGVSVSSPVASLSNSYVEIIPLSDESPAHFAIVYERVPGKQWEGELSPDKVERWGQLVGRMHAAAKSFKPAHPAWKRQEWHESACLDFASLLPGSEQELLSRCEAFISRLKSIPMTGDNYGLNHGNLHQHNVILDGDDGMTLIDFEEAEYNWFAADIAELVFNQAFHFDVAKEDRAAFAESFLRQFLTGYIKENSIDAHFFEHFRDFLRLRDLFLLGFATKNYYNEKRFERFLSKMSDSWTVIDIDYEKLASFIRLGF